MSESGQEWLIDGFRLRGPVEEFRDFCEHEIDRLGKTDPEFDPSDHREAMTLVLRKLSPGGLEGRSDH